MWPVITLFSHSSCWWLLVLPFAWSAGLAFLSCLSFLVSLFCIFAFRARLHDIRQQWFRTRWGPASPLAVEVFRTSMAIVSTVVRDVIPSISGERVKSGFDHWRACRGFAQLCVSWSVGALDCLPGYSTQLGNAVALGMLLHPTLGLAVGTTALAGRIGSGASAVFDFKVLWSYPRCTFPWQFLH